MNSLIKFAEFVNEIKADNGRLYKQGVLEKYKDDEDVKYYLNFVFNPFITTGISDKKLNSCNSTSWYEESFKDTKDVCEYLRINNTGRQYDVQQALGYRDLELPESVKELYEDTITKNLQLGVDAKTINKVIPGLIPTFSVMLANKYFDNPTVVDGKEFALTTKIDGSRIVAIKENGKVEFFTRQGQKYIGLVDLEKELEAIAADNFVFDGELVAIETTLDDTYKNTMKLSRTKEAEKHGLKMLVFDYMPVEDFKNQHSILPYAHRNLALQTMFCYYPFKFFEVLPILYCGTDTSKIIEILDEQVAKKAEGIMINITDAAYVFGRCNCLLKVKKFKDCDLRIIGFEEGTNKLIGTLGALVLDFKGNKLYCGSGFTDEQRDDIWQHQKEYLGKIAEIQYFEETHNQSGGLSLRFPVFKDIRFDKIEPNY